MRQPRDQHWADLLAALERIVDRSGGYGEIDVRIIMHDGRPRDVLELATRARYKLGLPQSVLRD